MRQSSILFLFGLLFLFMIFPSATSWCTNLVDEACKNYSSSRIYPHDSSPHYNFCKASLEAVPASRCADIRGLGFIAINLLRHNISNIQWQIQGLLGRKRLDEFSKMHLESCLHLYKKNAKALDHEVIKEYMTGKYEEAAVHVFSVVISGATCEYGLQYSRDWNSPLTKLHSDASRLAEICVSIMDMQRS